MKKIGYGVFGTAAPPVLVECLAGHERRLPWQRRADEELGWQRLVQILHSVVANRHLGVNDRIDDDAAAFGGIRQHGRRPVGPLVILAEKIEEHIGVDQRAVQSSPRVNAINSSVVMPGFGRGARRIASTRRFPRPVLLAFFLISTPSPTTSNSTSV
jgi:hypothetical protein